jgi:hypothetical protein
MALAQRAYAQAQKFGANVAIARFAKGISWCTPQHRVAAGQLVPEQ